jgi:hypothetical protein
MAFGARCDLCSYPGSAFALTVASAHDRVVHLLDEAAIILLSSRLNPGSEALYSSIKPPRYASGYSTGQTRNVSTPAREDPFLDRLFHNHPSSTAQLTEVPQASYDLSQENIGSARAEFVRLLEEDAVSE